MRTLKYQPNGNINYTDFLITIFPTACSSETELHAHQRCVFTGTPLQLHFPIYISGDCKPMRSIKIKWTTPPQQQKQPPRWQLNIFHISFLLRLVMAGRSGNRIPVEARDFPHPSRLVLQSTHPPAQRLPAIFAGVKRPGRGVNHSPSSSAEVKEIVQVYLYSLSGPSWPVIQWILLHFVSPCGSHLQ